VRSRGRRWPLVEEWSGETRYYSNRLARLYLAAMEDLLGSNGVAAVLRLARLGHLIGNYPPDTLDSEVSFEDFAAINESILEIYGLQGARGLCLRAGRATLRQAVSEGGLMADVPDPAFKLLPIGAKAKVGLNTLADVLGKFSDVDARLVERGGDLLLVIERCPECWGRVSDEPVCFSMAGMVHEALQWLTEEEVFRVTETECVARGDDSCTFVVSRQFEEEPVQTETQVTAVEDHDSPE
jgi:predicted hydrocarbon binding protein